MRTRSKARADLAAQAHPDDFNSSKNVLEVHPAEDPLPNVLETGFTTKRRRRDEGARKSRTRSQPVGNRMLADTPKAQRVTTARGSSSRNGARGKQVDLELKALGKRKRKMRGSLRQQKPVKLGRGDEDITQSIKASEDFCQDEAIQRLEGILKFGMPLRGVEEQPYSRPMTAKMRWKDRARSIINENEPDPSASLGVQSPSYEEQNVSDHPYWVSPPADESLPPQNLKTATCLEERGQHIGNSGNAREMQNRRKLKIRRQGSNKTKKQQRACRKRIGILKKLKLWATQTKVLQNALEPDCNSNGTTELRIVMTENDRENFVQKMVEKCRNNRHLRSSFLESVRMLVNSGLMQSAASILLKEGPCEEARVVVKAWENYKLQQSTGKGLPIDFLNAVVELHAKRKDLSGELARFEDSESCSLRQIHDSVWQIQIQNCASMEKSSVS